MEQKPRANILLVDDRPENLLALESVLTELNQNLISVTSAKEALRYLLLEDVALVLLDVQMPGLNGFEFAELIRERERTQHTPIIFISASRVEDQSIFKGYALGAVDYLAKPIQPEILKSKVGFFTKLYLQHVQIKRQAELLEKANEGLDKVNTDLESRVAARTKQLETANAELAREVEMRRESESRLSVEHSITRILSTADSTEMAMQKILPLVRTISEAEVVFGWMLDKEGQFLECKYWDVAELENLDALVWESRKLNLPSENEAPGMAWQSKSPATLSYFADHAVNRSPRSKAAVLLGLGYASAFPVLAGDEFYGAIELFSRAPGAAGSHVVNTLEVIGREIGQFIRRKSAETDRELLLAREKTLREQAENASNLKDEFLATVSHELRTPLNSILGWGQLLDSNRLKEEDQKKALEAIQRNAKSQAQLIDDLLDTSRLISGKLLLNLSPANILTLIESAMEALRPAAKKKALALRFDSSDPDISIICDPHRLQQMVTNLLTNAIKFTPEGGTVAVRSERRDGQLCISVSDTGKGISPDFQPFVFDRFRQADSSSTRSHDGLGLGLSIVRQLAELHGGTASVQSPGIGLGATFTLTFPLSGMDRVTEVNEGSVAAPSDTVLRRVDGIRVLIVDDDIDAREMLAFALGMQGARVATSASANEAFDAISAERPDILLTDINMPGEDGYSLIRKLRASTDPSSEIPAIALTALARSEDSDRALEAGFQMHIPKPIEIPDLITAIEGLTRRSNR
jgi:signal transduction histidine kinase/DNA-binding response OmpR family regulator